MLITAPIETRVERIIAEYSRDDPTTLIQLEKALLSLTKAFGKVRIGQMVNLLRQNDLEPLVKTLLEDYYDLRYLHAMRNYQYELEVDSGDLIQCATTLRNFAAQLPAPGPLAETG